jgi:hypothetical protein
MRVLVLTAILMTVAGCGSDVPREKQSLDAWAPMLQRALGDERPEVRAKGAAGLERLRSAGGACCAR